MMLMRSLALVLIAAATVSAQKAPSLSGTIDRGVRTVRGYDAKTEAPVAPDGEFLRRVMLDLVGYPPTLDQTRAFMADATPGKRGILIDALLESADFSDLWSRRFAEVFFGNYHDVPMDTMPALEKESRDRIVADFLWWFGRKLRQDRGWNEIVFEMLDARGTDEGDPALAYKLSFHRGEGNAIEFANGVSRQLLGIRLNCARCHDSPDGQWTVSHYYSLAAFNVRERARGYGGDHVRLTYAPQGEITIPNLEIDSDIVRKGKPGEADPLFFLGGGRAGPHDDRMALLARYMTSRRNTQLAKALVTRVWGWMFGRGLVHPVDDFRRGNRPVSTTLLNSLAKDFIDHGYSMKRLLRGICNSKAYQRACASDHDAYRVTFARGTIQPLTPEQLINSLRVAATGKPLRDPAKAMALVSSLFPASAVWCEVTPMPSNARQALLLRNNAEITGWIRSGGVLDRIQSTGENAAQRVEDLFLAVLSRRPTAEERTRYAAFVKKNPGSGLEDAFWTLINATEFVTRH